MEKGKMNLLFLVLVGVMCVGLYFKRTKTNTAAKDYYHTFDYHVNLNKNYTITVVDKHGTTKTLDSIENLEEYIINQNI